MPGSRPARSICTPHLSGSAPSSSGSPDLERRETTVSYMSSGSRFRVEAVAPNSEVDLLRAALRPDFLAAAGWKADEQILAPPRNHPLLGIRQCARKDCNTSVATPGHDLCRARGRNSAAASLSIEEFLNTTSGRPVRGERFCRVTGCPRPAFKRSGLFMCSAHDFRFFASIPQTTGRGLAARPPGQRRCQPSGHAGYPSCSRVAGVSNRLCHPHGLRWSRVAANRSRRRTWRFGHDPQEPPADSGRVVVFKGTARSGDHGNPRRTCNGGPMTTPRPP